MHSGIIIVSNRLPVSVKKVDGKLEFYPSVGGLATGLSSYVSDKHNKWIGWPGIASNELSEQDEIAITKELRKYNCYPVFLKKKQLDDYYNGYSNGVLWPLLHDLPVKITPEEQERCWKAYRAANHAFAEATLALSAPGSTIWVHDYQLMLLPSMLREMRPHDPIGFFLHIPFPADGNFAALPHAKSLVRGLLGSALVGFHTEQYVNNFLACCERLNVGIVESHKVLLGDRVVRVTDFPMGIDYAKFANATKGRAVKRELHKLRHTYRGKKVILTVDRLDPTKGLAERLEAYRTFLADNPDLHRKVVMVMLAVPSRTEIEEYKQLKQCVDKLVKDINAEFGSSHWRPVDYLYTSLPFEQLTALYQRADVAFIAPIRDGMNLVAKEYIASKPHGGGVLILSETAGAAEELKHAILVNPAQPTTLVTALKDALTMPRRELRRRARAMRRHIAHFTVHTWARTFMQALREPVASTAPRTRALSASRQYELVTAYQGASSRLLLLDYDGVLAPFVSDPEKAKPSEQLKKLLTDLAASDKNEVIIASGRSKEDLLQWFGDLPVGLVAEHGALFRRAGSTRWKHISLIKKGWKKSILPVLEEYAAKTPGAFVEEKEWSLVWHYRQADPYYAHKNLVILRRLFRSLTKSSGLIVQTGNMILEVRPRDINKGIIVQQMVKTKHDFVLILGDDFTDEDMFLAAPPEAYTVKIGRGRTYAQYRLPSVPAVLSLLKGLTD